MTLAEILQLTPEERDEILKAAALLVESEYAEGGELRDFEACDHFDS